MTRILPMNYLAHLYLADANGGSLIGQLLGDFVKGAPGRRYSKAVLKSILFHRRIDSFTDAHPATKASRHRISTRRRRFAGVIVDLCYDHFLALHWRQFSNEHLGAFTRRVYAELRENALALPERLDRMLAHMAANDWLGQYIHLDRVGMALDRIAGRLTRGERFFGGIADVRANYTELEMDFHAFFPDLVDFARDYKKT
jgi:acyl carrier protein phosphodiesterase